MPKDNISCELPDNIINMYRVYLDNENLKVCTITLRTHVLDSISFLVLTQKIFTCYFKYNYWSKWVCVCARIYTSTSHTFTSYVYRTVHHLDSWIKIDQLMSLAFFLLNMFRMLVHSSSGACDCVWVYCSGSMCVGVMVWFGWGGVVSLCRLRH
jgi:hypothetical protein